MKLTILAALAAFSLSAQTVASPVVAKPDGSVGVSAAKPIPVLNTSKLWRLLSKSQEAHRVSNDTPQAKAAAAADVEVQAEQSKLAEACVASGYVLGFQQDQKADNAGDLICTKAPPAEIKKDK